MTVRGALNCKTRCVDKSVRGGDIVHNIMECECASPDRFNDQLPVSLGKVILRTLQKDRDERHSTLAEFRNDLRSVHD